jgi:hypothetical protein
MQAFVPEYDCDLFISSARADGRPPGADGEHAADWAGDLSASLHSLIAQKLGRRDWGVVEPPSRNGKSLSARSIPRSAALLVVLTREYLRDDLCRNELESFLATLGNDDVTTRVFAVLADDIGRDAWPAALQHHLAFEFLTTPEPADPGGSAERRRLQVADKLYPVRLDDLSTEIANCLERLKAVATGSPGVTTATVFLGSASPDVIELRDGMRRYLVQEGFRIEPHRWYPPEPAGYRDAALNDLRNSQLFVQLLGSQPFSAVNAPASLGGMEVDLAEEIGLPVLSWRDPRLDVELIGDVEHRRLVEGKFVLAVGIEEFKRKVVEKAHAQASKPATASDKPLVVVAASAVDRPLAQRVAELLGGKGLGIEIPDTEEFPWELYSNGKQGVGGLVIVYGACPAIWVRQQLWKYRKAMARTESRPPLCAVCEGPPQVKEPLRYDVPQMDLIDCKLQVTEAALSSFIEAVQRRCSQ